MGGSGSGIIYAASKSTNPAPLGSIGIDGDNLFRPCPDSPNCISTQANPTNETHFIKPLTYHTSRQKAIEIIHHVITDMPRTKIITLSSNYIHIEFTTTLWRFVDDVEFYFPADQKVIHFTSRSRIGYSDLGLNRKRSLKIAKLFYDRIKNPLKKFMNNSIQKNKIFIKKN